jgi:CheY-like chemotaxis protein
MTSLSILAVDDEDSIRHLLARFFEVMGHRVACAANGIEALGLLAKDRFDLIITDVLMPEMDGIELIRRIRKERPDAYIMAISGGGDSLLGDFCIRLASGMGANSVLMKPFTMAEVRAAIESAFPVPGGAAHSN